MKLFALAAAALLAAPAFAGVTTIDFEGVTGFTSIGDSYAAAGINFGPDAQGLVNDALGPYFSNAPTPVGVMFVSGVNLPDAAMNVAPGFNALSFYYSSADAVTDAVKVWTGANGTGILVASYNLAANAKQYRTKLSSMGGGGGSYVGYSIPAKLASNDDVTFSAVARPADVVITGTSALGFGTVDATIEIEGLLLRNSLAAGR